MFKRRAEACSALPGASLRGMLRALAPISLSGALLISFALLGGCAAPEPPFNSTEVSGIDYGRSVVIRDTEGRARRLEDFRDQVVVVFFGFTTCPDVCPTTLLRLKGVRESLGTDGERLQVLLISVDPERDTPERLDAYVKNFGPSVIGLRPEPAELEKVVAEFRAIAVRVPSADGSDYTVDHSATLYVYDRGNRLRLLAQPPLDYEALTADLRRLLREEA